MSNINMRSIQEVVLYLGELFQKILTYLDKCKIAGTFSFLDFILACLVIDIVITAFFVTFNVGFSSDRVEYTDSKGNRKTKVRRSSSSTAHVGK